MEAATSDIDRQGATEFVPLTIMKHTHTQHTRQLDSTRRDLVGLSLRWKIGPRHIQWKLLFTYFMNRLCAASFRRAHRVPYFVGNHCENVETPHIYVYV